MGDEKRIVEDYLVKQVERRGGLCIKFPPIYHAGFPDRELYMPNGVHLLVETKAPHIKGVDKLQEIIHRRLRRLGHRVEVCNTRQLVDELLKEFDI